MGTDHVRNLVWPHLIQMDVVGHRAGEVKPEQTLVTQGSAFQ